MGFDGKTRLLAAELSPLYESVKMLQQTLDGLKESKYRGIHGLESGEENELLLDEEESFTNEEVFPAHAVDEPIVNLLLSGAGIESIHKMIELRHRIDSQTAICLMHDGLGVAERLNDQVFSEHESKPTYVLGQFTHHSHKMSRSAMVTSLGAEKRAGYVSLLKNPSLETLLVPIDPAIPSEATSPIADRLIGTWRSSRHLRANHTPFDNWVRFKLKSMIFAAVVDPVCIVVGCRYSEVLGNSRAIGLVNKLLDEIQLVASCLPEVVGSPLMQEITSGEILRKACFGRLRRAGDFQSVMAKRISRGRFSDIDSFNGYFIKRGDALGLTTPYNRMVVDIVKAKRRARWEYLSNQIPFEVTSMPGDHDPQSAWPPKSDSHSPL